MFDRPIFNLTGKNCEPLPGRSPFYRQSLRFSDQLPMKDDFDLANLRQTKFPVSEKDEPGLGIGDAIISVERFEPRKSGLFARFDTPVEVLEGFRETVAHVL